MTRRRTGGASRYHSILSPGRVVGALLVLVSGCGATPLSPGQRAALLQRIQDQGDVAVAAVQARDRAQADLAAMRGRPVPDADRSTVAFLLGETAALKSDVAAALR